jgi:hypothetical protein
MVVAPASCTINRMSIAMVIDPSRFHYPSDRVLRKVKAAGLTTHEIGGSIQAFDEKTWLGLPAPEISNLRCMSRSGE